MQWRLPFRRSQPAQSSERAHGIQVPTVLAPINPSCEDEEGCKGGLVPRLAEKASTGRGRKKRERRRGRRGRKELASLGRWALVSSEAQVR